MEEQLLTASIMIIMGILGQVLPYRWNILKPRRFVEGMIPERARPTIPKVVGVIFIVIGLISGALAFVTPEMVGSDDLEPTATVESSMGD